MFEPTTLPTARSVSPRHDAPTLTASSGALVPNATTVRPITTGVSPVRAANRADPRTNASAPTTSAAMPTTKKPSVHTDMVGQSGVGQSEAKRASRCASCSRYVAARSSFKSS